MTRTVASLLVLVVTVAGSCGCAGDRAAKRSTRAGGDAPAPVRLTVMTYNIHHGEGMDKRLDLARIADVIRKCEPDLVALQEVDARTKRTNGVMQAAELARLTNMHHAYGPAMDFDGGKYGNAILSRFPIESSGTVPLPHRPGDRREPRVALWSQCRLPNASIRFVSTHLDHTPEPSDRVQQAKTIAEKLSGDGWTSPAILAADFNCEPDSPPMAELARDWTIVSNDSGNTPTVPANAPRSKIDHVLVRPRERWRVIEVRVIEEPVASDHRPVVVRLELTAGD
jgi:endonuclease/exonuclease/phosphatase family metal-dependent hydrolase